MSLNVRMDIRSLWIALQPWLILSLSRRGEWEEGVTVPQGYDHLPTPLSGHTT